MNNTDKIIAYLSGEMEQSEADQFELFRSTDPELENAFQAIRKIWEMTRENLMLEYLPEEKIRDQLIAEVMAHHDIEQYRNTAPSKKTTAFRSALEKAAASMQEPGNKKDSRPGRISLPTILLAAASLVLLVLVIRPATDLRELAISYYDPSGSTLASQHAFKTRSNEAQALLFFRDGDYKTARYYFEAYPDAIADDPMAQLFYGITCHETGDTEKAVTILQNLATQGTSGQESSSGRSDTVSYHAKWFLSLILVNEGKTEEAIPFLIDLSRTEGPFNKKSTRLLQKTE